MSTHDEQAAHFQELKDLVEASAVETRNKGSALSKFVSAFIKSARDDSDELKHALKEVGTLEIADSDLTRSPR